MERPKMRHYFSALSGSRKKWSSKQQGQKEHQDSDRACYLLELPAELILDMIDCLRPIDLYLLSQTCRTLRAILNKHTSATILSKAERFLYLTHCSRENPEKWVCGTCIAYHPVFMADIAKSPQGLQSSCPYAQRRSRRIARTFHVQIGIEHRHVQLALKYTRLHERKYNSRIRALLAPHNDRDFTSDISFSSRPRVVKDYDGNLRYLVFIKWRQYDIKRMASQSNASWALPVCSHIKMDSYLPAASYRQASYLLQTPPNLTALLQCAVERALQDKNKYFGWCSHCATDFEVQNLGECLELHVWRDLGTEDSLLGTVLNTTDGRMEAPDYMDYATNGPYYNPGTIRKLYQR